MGEGLKPRGDDDIHALRYSEQLKLEEAQELPNYIEPITGELDNKFIFEFPENAKKIDFSDLGTIEIENPLNFHLIPTLAHNLEVVVKNPGIYPVEEISKLLPDKGVYLRKIYQPEEIDFSKIPPYKPPSQDEMLLAFAREHNCKYIMSTSTISNLISQIFYVFSNFRNPNFQGVNQYFENEAKKYMVSQRKPTTMFLRSIPDQKNVYALDNDSGLFEFPHVILMDLGKIMERSLTLDENTFLSALLKQKPPTETPPSENQTEEQKQELKQQQELQKTKEAEERAILDPDYHRFMIMNNNCCLRSQIDCRAIDPVTKESFVFEIKTRSVCPIRYDIDNYKDYLDYKLLTRDGLHSSYQREYYDLIRGAFLKYSIQLRIGRMDGAFVAYHNTHEVQGFEYIKRKEIEERIFGNEYFASANLLISSKISTLLFDLILEDLKGQKFEMLKIGVYADSPQKRLVIFVELFENYVEWGSTKLFKATPEIQDEYDYYTKYKPFTNKLYKYEMILFTYLNGVYVGNSQFNVNKGDQIDVKYNFNKLGKPTFLDYMNFLHEAYKFDTLNVDQTYAGVWLRR